MKKKDEICYDLITDNNEGYLYNNSISFLLIMFMKYISLISLYFLKIL